MKRKRWMALAVFLMVLLTGCWDRTELEDQSYVILLGLDRGESSQIMVSAEVAIPQSLSAGILGARPVPGEIRLATKLLTAQAETINEAINILNGAMTRRLDLRHLRSVIIGEPLAREGIEPLMMELQRHSLVHASALLVQARGRAFDLLKVFDPVGEINPGRMAEGLTLQAKQMHLTPPSRMHHFLLRLAAPGGDPFLPVGAANPWIENRPQEPQPPRGISATAGQLSRGGGDPVEFIGTAIFRGDRLAGFLNIDETQMLLALRGEMGKAVTTFPDPTAPGRPVTVRIHQENKPKVTASYRGTTPHVQVRLLLEGEVLAAPGGTDFVQPAMRARLEKGAAQYVNQTCRSLLEKLQDWGADPVGFGYLYRGKFASWGDAQRYDWHSLAKNLQVETISTMRIRRYGLVTGPDRARGVR